MRTVRVPNSGFDITIYVEMEMGTQTRSFLRFDLSDPVVLAIF
jgi:hypothetical protein